MLLTITGAGRAAENDALAGTTPLPPIAKLLVGAGPAIDPPGDATAMADPWHEVSELVVERLSDSAMKLTAEVSAATSGWIREIGIELSDGTLYAYAPYAAESDGLFKGEGFSFTFYVIISREDIDQLTVEYAALDVTALSAQIAAEARAEIDTDFQTYWIAITKHLSSLNRETLAIIDENHKENGRYA